MFARLVWLAYQTIPIMKCGIEPWEYIRANKMDFFEGNVIKYVTRWRNKNCLDDLRKARVYIDELIRQEECKNE